MLGNAFGIQQMLQYRIVDRGDLGHLVRRPETIEEMQHG